MIAHRYHEATSKTTQSSSSSQNLGLLQAITLCLDVAFRVPLESWWMGREVLTTKLISIADPLLYLAKRIDIQCLTVCGRMPIRTGCLQDREKFDIGSDKIRPSLLSCTLKRYIFGDLKSEGPDTDYIVWRIR